MNWPQFHEEPDAACPQMTRMGADGLDTNYTKGHELGTAKVPGHLRLTPDSADVRTGRAMRGKMNH
jgi:hypothetical protein